MNVVNRIVSGYFELSTILLSTGCKQREGAIRKWQKKEIDFQWAPNCLPSQVHYLEPQQKAPKLHYLSGNDYRLSLTPTNDKGWHRI